MRSTLKTRKLEKPSSRLATLYMRNVDVIPSRRVTSDSSFRCVLYYGRLLKFHQIMRPNLMIICITINQIRLTLEFRTHENQHIVGHSLQRPTNSLNAKLHALWIPCYTHLHIYNILPYWSRIVPSTVYTRKLFCTSTHTYRMYAFIPSQITLIMQSLKWIYHLTGYFQLSSLLAGWSNVYYVGANRFDTPRLF